MAVVNIDAFGGIRPRYGRRIGPTNRAEIAENLKLWNGTLMPIRQPKEIAVSDRCVNALAVFGCDILVDQNPCASFALGPKPCRRIFATGLCDYPYPVTAAYSPGCSLGIITPDWKRLGLPQPAAVSFTVPDLTAPIAPPSIIQGTQPDREHRDYVITYVNSFGEESAPSLGSPDAGDADQTAPAVVVIGPRPPEAEGWDIVAVRIYRMISGNLDGSQDPDEPVYLFVHEVDLTNTLPTTQVVYEDVNQLDLLGEPPPPDCVAPPPADLRGIVQMESGPMVGFVGDQLWFTEPFEHHNWNCFLTLDDCIKGVVEVDHALYVATDGHPYTIGSKAPDTECLCCRSTYRHPEPAPMMSDHRGIVPTSNGAIWPTDNGLVRLTGNSMTLVSHAEIDEDSWMNQFHPNTLKSATLDGRYYGFGRTAFMFDYTDGVYADGDVGVQSRLVTFSYYIDAAYTDSKGKMWVAMGNAVYLWDAGADYEIYTWRSQVIQARSLTNWSAAILVFEAGGTQASIETPVNFSVLNTKGHTLDSVRVINERPFRVRHGIRERSVQIEIRGTAEIAMASLASSIPELTLGMASE